MRRFLPIASEVACLMAVIGIVLNGKSLEHVESLKIARHVDGVVLAYILAYGVGAIGVYCSSDKWRRACWLMSLLSFVVGMIGPATLPS